MVIEVAVLILLVIVAGIGLWRRQRRRSHLKRYEDRTHRLYLRTKRDNWVKRWLYGNRTKRLNDHRHQSSAIRTDQTL